MKTLWSSVLVCALAASTARAADDIEILRYKESITPDLTTKTITGRTIIRLRVMNPGVSEVRFPRHDLIIDAVTFDGRATAYHKVESDLVISLPNQPGTTSRDLSITYHGKPLQGLIFGPNYVYTAFSTCHWMICREESGDKAAFDIEVEAPKAYRVIASGREVGVRTRGEGRAVHSWREDQPYSPYLFGFAMGEFAEASSRAGATDLHLFGIGETSESLSRKFADTARMVRFFEEKAGVALPHGFYTQVLVPGSQAQETSTFSVVGRDELDPILTDPEEDWVIAHELAHQWWGNLVTCRRWTHFWLNEGLTVFLVAAYKEDRWGRAAYDREMELAAKRHTTAVAAGFDVALAYSKDYPSLRIKRAITYSKAALFLDTPRKDVGDAAFWAGLRDYTRRFLGKTVESRDFQDAMERACGRSLKALFDAWVNE